MIASFLIVPAQTGFFGSGNKMKHQKAENKGYQQHSIRRESNRAVYLRIKSNSLGVTQFTFVSND